MSLFKNVVKHLHGETPHLRDIIAVYLLAGGVGVAFILSCSERTLSDWLMALLAADLAGGIVSNATASTRAYFRKQSIGARRSFFFLHGLVYPIIIITMMGLNQPLGVLMLVGCATKICLYAVPDRANP